MTEYAISTSGGRCLLRDLPDDLLAIVSGAMCERDLLNLSMTCRKFKGICESDKLWMPHCVRMVSMWPVDLTEWRSAMDSCKALFRFLFSLRSLVGIWVHQNPELGNLVYVTWGFISVVACRIIPQEMGPSGFDTGLLWAPVFEIIGKGDGTLVFFLHGRDREKDYCYPGRFKAVKDTPNVLLLEAEPLLSNVGSRDMANIPSMTMVDQNDHSGEDPKVFPRSNGSKGKTIEVRTDPVPFHRLVFGDRRRLLEVLAPQVRLKVPHTASGPLFPSHFGRAPHSGSGRAQSAISSSVSLNQIYRKELLQMAERRLTMLSMYLNSAEDGTQRKSVESASLLRSMCSSVNSSDSSNNRDLGARPVNSLQGNSSTISISSSQPVGRKGQSDSLKKLGFARFVRTKMKQIIGKNTGQEVEPPGSPTNVDMKRSQLQEFLKQGNTVGLRLHATSWRLSFYRAWPIMHDNRFALYKIPEQKPVEGREHAGLWGGTFGWPPGRPVEEKPGRALFFLLLSYNETEEGCVLIATKILEGTHYVLHPNGSAMFMAKVDEPSSEKFPWEKNSDGGEVDIVQSFQGEGIANGYGFRYPGSKPGDLFVDSNGVLAFVWRESQAVLSLQRMDLQSLLEAGERVAALPPVANFAYLTKAHSNVFTGYCGHMAIARTKSHETSK